MCSFGQLKRLRNTGLKNMMCLARHQSSLGPLSPVVPLATATVAAVLRVGAGATTSTTGVDDLPAESPRVARLREAQHRSRTIALAAVSIHGAAAVAGGTPPPHGVVEVALTHLPAAGLPAGFLLFRFGTATRVALLSAESTANCKWLSESWIR